jgi:Flp pilus assembly protein TadD
MKKKVFIGLILVLVLIAGGYGGRRAYIHLRQARLIKQARDHIANKRDKKAILCLQRVIRGNPKDIEACRLMARLMESEGSPTALLWRSRVVQLDPKATDDRLALAVTATMMREYGLATNALEGVSETGKKSADYHNIAGMVASTVNRLPEAEAHFLEATKLAPTNPVPQLNLAVVRLQQTNAAVQAAARTAIQQLRTNPLIRCQALRQLVNDAMRYRQTNTAVAMSKELLETTNSTFSDQLLRLDVLRLTGSSEFKSSLGTFQKEAANDPGKVTQLALWEMTRTNSAGALAWMKSLSRDMQTNQAIAMLVAECHIQLPVPDWRGLQTSIEKQNWGEMEFTRHAYLARSLRGQELMAASKTEWDQAMKEAERNQQTLVMLLRQAAQWNWINEGEEILWTIVKRYPSEKWAVRALTQALYVGGRTRSLMSLYSQEAKKNPSDLSIKNNVAMTAMLIDAQEMKPHELAREVYEKGSTNASFVSTYAFSLYQQKKNAEALKILEQLKPKELEEPSMAGYYGIILKASGNRAKAKACLELASKAQLLPEERKLFESARAGL